MKIVRAIKIAPGQPPELIELPPADLGCGMPQWKMMSDIVGGHLDFVKLVDDNILLWRNEDGDVLELPPNRLIYGDVYLGTLLIAGQAGEDIVGLTDAQIAQVLLDIAGWPPVVDVPVLPQRGVLPS